MRFRLQACRLVLNPKGREIISIEGLANNCRFSSSDERSWSDETLSLRSKKKSESCSLCFFRRCAFLATRRGLFWAHCYPLPRPPISLGRFRPDRVYRSGFEDWGGGAGGGEDGRRWEFGAKAVEDFDSLIREKPRRSHNIVHCLFITFIPPPSKYILITKLICITHHLPHLHISS